MAKSAADLVSHAKSRVTTIPATTAHDHHKAGKGVILDVREPGELTTSGAPHGSVHVPRGLLEFKADSGDTGHPALKEARTSGQMVMVLCASGGRAALAASTLTDMGYDAQIIEGGMQGWTTAGLESVKG